MLEPRTTVLATCAPFLPGYGFRAELHHVALPSGRDVYRLVSWDAAIIREDGPATMEGPTLRAECNVDDYNPGAGPGPRTDAHLAAILCSFWSAYALMGREEWLNDPDSQEEYESEANDHRRIAMDNADWWRRWDDTGGGLTGMDDDENPDTWTCDDYQPAQD